MLICLDIYFDLRPTQLTTRARIFHALAKVVFTRSARRRHRPNSRAPSLSRCRLPRYGSVAITIPWLSRAVRPRVKFDRETGRDADAALASAHPSMGPIAF
ncbi:hypothetical protein EVAR_36092_1 [Eumeta japonica]|uniref:Uncharacterized protein n=1 Tax=Eumeta variegata TaxID=151549 RepID=A0A4C1YKG3_EUMVA|nr:hypothetical protein EVAR_36092_1 [Eumeta japonica]